MGIADRIKEALKGRDSMTPKERAKFEATRTAMAGRRYRDKAYYDEKIRDANERAEWKLELERAKAKNKLVKAQARMERRGGLRAMREARNNPDTMYDPLGVGAVFGESGVSGDMSMITGELGSQPKKRRKGGQSEYINLLDNI